jgi:hypothetical protein
MRVTLTEGQTHPVDVVLRAAGVPIVFDPGDRVELILKTQNGRVLLLAGTVGILVPDPSADPPVTSGTVRYTPAAGDLRAAGSPYLARWQVTTASGVYFVPSDVEDVWTVRTP